MSVAIIDEQKAFGTTTPSGSIKVSGSSIQTITAAPNPGFELDYWEDNGKNIGKANPLMLSMNDSYHTVYAHFIQLFDASVNSNNKPASSSDKVNNSKVSCDFDIFEELGDLLLKERAEILSKSDNEVVKYKAKVLAFSDSAATIKCDKANQFEKQEEISIIKKDKTTINACTVFEASSNILSLTVPEGTSFFENEPILLLKTDLLIALELQLGLLDKIKREEIDPQSPPVKFFLDNAPLLDLKQNCSITDLKAISIAGAEEIQLDDAQVEAVEKVLSLQDGEFVLIIGPPGTGKTKVIKKIAVELTNKGEKVLICSHTNIAVDNAIEGLPLDIALRIGKPEKVLAKDYLLNQRIKEASEEFRRLSKEIKRLRIKCREIQKFVNIRQASIDNSGYKGNLLSCINEIRGLEQVRDKLLKDNQKKLVSESQIIGSTLIRAQLPPLEDICFDTVIIDEASQASISLALLAMVKAKKWVLVGDHKQLLPIFKNLPDDVEAKRFCVFTHLMGKYENRATWLTQSYRSNSVIMDFLAKYVYSGKIKSAPSCSSIKLKVQGDLTESNSEILDPEKPIVFVDVGGITCSDGESKYNNLEVDVCCKIANLLFKKGVETDKIGVITPYRSQRQLLASKIHDAEVKTVDSFQGREKEVIIFVLTATEILKTKALQNPNKLNVAFSRPRSKLIVIGNAKTIHNEYKTFVSKEPVEIKHTRLAHLLLENSIKNRTLYSWKNNQWVI